MLLTKRRDELQVYLTEVITALVHRAPIELLKFLQIDEQMHLGFFDSEINDRMTEINLTKAKLKIVKNKILINHQGVH